MIYRDAIGLIYDLKWYNHDFSLEMKAGKDCLETNGLFFVRFCSIVLTLYCYRCIYNI